jgi:tetratricopeptide (TPR) repeat protein
MHTTPTLANWTFVRLPENPAQYVDLWQTLQQYRTKVVVWLDDLAKFRDDRNGSLIARLPYDLEERRIPFVIIATLHDEDSDEVHGRFGGLLDHLVQVRPGDLTAVEGSILIEQLRGAGETVYSADRFDGTPGSIILAVDYMSNQVYPRLPDSAKDILRSIKLLRSASVQQYNLERILRTATSLYNHKQADDTRDLEALRGGGFLRQTVVDNGRVVLLEPVTEVYLDVAVPYYSDPATAMAEWPNLAKSFEAAQDAYALVRLGDAFRRESDDEHAERCYRSALQTLTRGAAPQDWALAYYGLGDVLSRRVDVTDVTGARKVLEEAEDAFNRVLQVVSLESDPTFWAEIQGRRAEVIRLEATTTVGRPRRVKLLDEATKNCRDALKILRRDTSPDEWAEAQKNLGLVLLTHSLLAQDANTRRRMLDNALEALTASLTVFAPENQPYRWTRAQRALGDASRLRAEASNQPRKSVLLRQAVNAYAHAVGMVRPVPLWHTGEQAEILENLGTTAFTLGMLLDGSERADLLQEAAARSKAAAEIYAGLQQYEQGVQATQTLATACAELATIRSSDATSQLLDDAIAVTANALTYLSGQRSNEATKKMRAQVHLELAQLYWARSSLTGQHPTLAMQKDIEEAASHVRLALDYLTKENAPSEYQQATRLQRNTKARAASLATTATSATPANLEHVHSNDAITSAD